MVYKPKKRVNGHKKYDRYTRRRKRAAAAKRRAAAAPVRSNVKRYVAQQFGKTHPDNRYIYTLERPINPTNQLSNTPRYYPFGADFQKRFIDMEFRRMREVIAQFPSQIPVKGGQPSVTADATTLLSTQKFGDFNHWKSLLGRGIHMKNSSVYGEIRLNEKIPLRFQNILKYGNLKLHMFCLEDKAVTKTEFLNWYKDLVAHTYTDANDGNAVKATTEKVRSVNSSNGPVSNGHYDEDLLNVPYVAGSRYMSNVTKGVAGSGNSDTVRPDGGFDEFLMDWDKFYDTNSSTNPIDSLFYNEVKCTTSWDGSRRNSNLPVNKSRFIVHEHKTWSFKPKANGCLDTVIPFNYSFPEHRMTYDKELLDMPFLWNSDTDAAMETDSAAVAATKDNQGLDSSWLFPRKQPYIVFVYTCDNPYMLDVPYGVDDIPNHPGGNHPDFGGTDNLLRGPHNNNTELLNVAHPLGGSTSLEQRHGGLGVRTWTTGTEPKLYAPYNVAKIQYQTGTNADGTPIMVTSDENAKTTSHSQWNRPYIASAEYDALAQNDLFEIDMHFKCSYENPLATSIVPTINKGRPIIHKRESAPAPKPKRPFNKRDAPMDPVSRKKYTQKTLKDIFKVRRNAGSSTSRDQSRAREEVIAKGKQMRLAMRRQEAKVLDDIVLPPTISPKAAHARDSYYLSKAQQTPSGLYVRGNFLYIFGTRTKADVGIRWPQIAAGNVGVGKFMLTERYKAAEKVLKANPHIKTVVGHSYGATTAYALTRNFRVKGRAYGSPVARIFNDARFQSFRHSGDPVSILDFAAKTSKRPFKGPLDAHSYKFHDGRYKSRRAFIDHDDL